MIMEGTNGEEGVRDEGMGNKRGHRKEEEQWVIKGIKEGNSGRR